MSASDQSVVMTREQQDSLALALATGIFNCDSQQGRPTTRLQFMSGQWPNNERAEGGLCFVALVSVMQSLIQQHTSRSSS